MSKDLISRLNEGPVLCAEGYLFAMERRGYLQAGAFVPEVVLEHPEVVSQLHREFIRAGSDVVQAFTYYGHREKLRIIGKENLLEPLQKNALKIAKDARNEFKDLDLLVCGDVANTNIYDPNDKKTNIECQKMFEEQVMWAKEAGVDFIIAETITWLEEAKIALKTIKDVGLIAVSNFSINAIESEKRPKLSKSSKKRIFRSFCFNLLSLFFSREKSLQFLYPEIFLKKLTEKERSSIIPLPTSHFIPIL